jgi:hypothetical protein
MLKEESKSKSKERQVVIVETNLIVRSRNLIVELLRYFSVRSNGSTAPFISTLDGLRSNALGT